MAGSKQQTVCTYEIPAGAQPPPLAGLAQVARVTGPERQELEADYYDTGDLRLLHAGVTLHRRSHGDGAGWHLTLQARSGASHQVRLPAGHDGQPVPMELEGLVRAHTRGETLQPVARITTRRQRWLVLGESGDTLAEVADDDVSAQTLGESTTLSRWRELAVKLTGGGPDLLAAADQELRRAGLRPAALRQAPWPAGLRTAPGAVTLARALGREPPAARPAPGPASSAGDLVLAYLDAHLAALKALDPLARRDEPDAVHQMRVESRRLRGTLRSYQRLLDRDGTAAAAESLKWLGGMLGRPRDAEVLAERLAGELREFPAEMLLGPVQARTAAHFARSGSEARRELLAALDSERYLRLLDDLDRLLAEPPLTRLASQPAGDVVPGEVRRAYRQASRRMQRALRPPAGPARDVALHQARKSARRARYAAEAAVPLAGRRARRFAKQMKAVQSVLGEHQDCVISSQVARELGISAHLAGENAFSYGLLCERDRQRGCQLQARAEQVWRRASRGLYRRWLR